MHLRAGYLRNSVGFALVLNLISAAVEPEAKPELLQEAVAQFNSVCDRIHYSLISQEV